MSSYHNDFDLNHLPWGCEETNLGDLKGADYQYRCPGNLHVRQYGSRYVGHIDKIDPRTDLVGHLLVDVPVATAVGIGLSTAAITSFSGQPQSAIKAGIIATGISLVLSALVNSRY